MIVPIARKKLCGGDVKKDIRGKLLQIAVPEGVVAHIAVVACQFQERMIWPQQIPLLH